MPRFHLNLLSLEGPLIVLDEEGADYPGIEHAYLAAFNAALELWGQLLRNREDPRLRVFHITDASGLVVMTLPLREVPRRLSIGSPRALSSTFAHTGGRGHA